MLDTHTQTQARQKKWKNTYEKHVTGIRWEWKKVGKNSNPNVC